MLSSCGDRDGLEEGSVLEKVHESGTITVITRNSAHSYYSYRGIPMGFEYDLAKAFSEYLGVNLKVITPKWQNLVAVLDDSNGDFIAASLTATPSRKQQVDFSNEYLSIRQMVVLHKDNYKIRTLEDLKGKTIHVRKGTSYEERLKELKDTGLDIQIKLHNDTPTEVLISRVAEKKIEVTIADSNIAKLNRRYYPDVKIVFSIEEPQSLAWAVKKGETTLLAKMNEFLKSIKENGMLDETYEKYYGNAEVFDYVDLKKYHQRLETRLPKYKRIIKTASKKHGFDWRLIAALIYQESHFDPQARSYTGAEGLMQITKTTAKELGISDRRNPKESIMGGVKYLKRLYRKYDEAEHRDRVLIALASYNAGHRHVRDAMRIAEEMKLDPHSWPSLVKTLPLLCYPKYYVKSRYGYCRGSEPVRYVNRILNYYDILKQQSIG